MAVTLGKGLNAACQGFKSRKQTRIIARRNIKAIIDTLSYKVNKILFPNRETLLFNIFFMILSWEDWNIVVVNLVLCPFSVIFFYPRVVHLPVTLVAFFVD